MCAGAATGPFVSGLRCRACGRGHDAGVAQQFCDACWGPLDVTYELPADPALALDETAPGAPTMWRYAPLLGAPDPGAAAMGIGRTPLVAAPDLGAGLGVPGLWLKDETANPSGSFKDRLVAAALAVAAARGSRVAACASTGNLASSLALLAPRFEMRWVVLVPAGTATARVDALAAAPGGTVVAVDGDYDACNRLAGELAGDHPEWAWVNGGLRAWYADAARTLAFEVAEDLGWQAPDRVVVPMASGATAVKVSQGFDELVALGLVGAAPRLTVVQPAGCAPVATAFAAGTDTVDPVRPATMATSLAMGDPPDGSDVLVAVRGSGGVVEAVPEDAIRPVLMLLERATGLSVDPAAAVAVAAVERLRQRDEIGPAEVVVVYVTGDRGPPADDVQLAAVPIVAPTVAAVERLLTSSRSE